MHLVRPLPSKLPCGRPQHGGDELNILVIGGGFAAVVAAERFLAHGHPTMLITAHAEFGFPHGGCGLWDLSDEPWPLDALEEAVAKEKNGVVACRSQWLVKRLVHRFVEAGGKVTCRARLDDEPEANLRGTGAMPLPALDHVVLADQDVPEPDVHRGVTHVLFDESQPVVWHGRILAPHHDLPATVDAAGRRGDGTVEVWSQHPVLLQPLAEHAIEHLQVTWSDDGLPTADAVAARSRAAVDAFLG
jgi:hypothetical protein